jgi:hypothetical protein
MALSISCWLFYSTYSYASKHNKMISSLEEKTENKRPGLSRLFSSFVLPPYLEIARPATKSRSSSRMGVCVCWAQVCAARPSRQRIWRWRLNRRRQSSSGKSFLFSSLFLSPSIRTHPRAPGTLGVRHETLACLWPPVIWAWLFFLFFKNQKSKKSFSCLFSAAVAKHAT